MRKNEPRNQSKRTAKVRRRLAACIAAVLAAVLFALPAFAAVTTTPSVIDPDKKGSLTITKVKENDGYWAFHDGLPDESLTNVGMEGIIFKAVKVADIVTASDTTSAGTYFDNVDAGFLSILGTVPTKSVGGREYYTTEAISDALEAKLDQTGATPGEVVVNNYVKNSSASGAYTFAATDADGRTSLSDLPLGLYLVAETDWSGYVAKSVSEDPDVNADPGSKEVVYNPSSPFLVMLPMTNRSSVNGQDSATAWQYDVSVYPKNTTVTIPKYIVNEDDGDTLIQSDDNEIGEVVKQLITPSVPAVINDRYIEKYVVRDDMDEGLYFKELISVKLGEKIANPTALSQYDSYTVLVKDTDYALAVDEDKHGFSVTFLEAGLAKLNAVTANSQVIVEFDSYLDWKATEVEPNTNKPTLTWKNKNTVEASVEGNEPRVYTYRIELTKKGVDDPTNVTFRITRKSDGAVMSFVEETAGSGIWHPYDNSMDGDTEATEAPRVNAEGKIIFRGLDEDTYTFTEVSTENGYELMKSSFDITLSGNDPVDGELAGASLVIDGKENTLAVTDNMAACAVENFKSITLHTGGAGNAYVFIAAAFFAAAAALLIRRDKKAA